MKLKFGGKIMEDMIRTINEINKTQKQGNWTNLAVLLTRIGIENQREPSEVAAYFVEIIEEIKERV